MIRFWFAISLFVLWSSTGLAQCPCKNIYVWRFNNKTGNSTLEEKYAELFEELLISRGNCTVLERRNFATALKHEENENSLTGTGKLPQAAIKKLTDKAQVVVLGTIDEETVEGKLNRIIKVKFLDLQTKQIIKESSLARPIEEFAGIEKEKAILGRILDQICGQSFAISNLSIADTVASADGLLVDLDPLIITWDAQGQPQNVVVYLENARTHKRTPETSVLSSEGRLVFNCSFRDCNYKEILNDRVAGEYNPVRAVIRAADKTYYSNEEKLTVGIQLLVFAPDSATLEIVPLVDNSEVKAYSFAPEVIIVDKNMKPLFHQTISEPTSHPTIKLTNEVVKKGDWHRLVLLPNCVRDIIDDRMIRQLRMLEKLR